MRLCRKRARLNTGGVFCELKGLHEGVPGALGDARGMNEREGFQVRPGLSIMQDVRERLGGVRAQLARSCVTAADTDASIACSMRRRSQG
jgi:hypothetical protein